LLALPDVEEADAQDQGLYGDFPVGNLKFATEIGCECYFGLSSALQKSSTACTLVSKLTEPLLGISQTDIWWNRNAEMQLYSQFNRPGQKQQFKIVRLQADGALKFSVVIKYQILPG
jgi:hypothetical protein